MMIIVDYFIIFFTFWSALNIFDDTPSPSREYKFLLHTASTTVNSDRLIGDPQQIN